MSKDIRNNLPENTDSRPEMKPPVDGKPPFDGKMPEGMPPMGGKMPEGMPPFDGKFPGGKPPKGMPKDFDPEKMKEMMEKGEMPDFPKPKGIMKLLMPKMPDMREEKDTKTGMEKDNPGYRPLVRPDNSKDKGPRRGPPGRGGMRGEKPKDFKGSMKKLIGYLMDFKWLVLLVALCSVCSTVLSTVNPRSWPR